MFAVGGRSSSSSGPYDNLVELYSFDTADWEVVPDHPLLSISYPAVISVRAFFFTFGGDQVELNQATELIYGFDTTQKIWFPAGTMNRVRKGFHNAFVADGQVIIAGEEVVDRPNALSEKCSLTKTDSERTFTCRNSAVVALSDPRFFEVKSEFNKC